MKIRTDETSRKYERWEYEVEDLPDNFDDMSVDERFEWLQMSCTDAVCIHSEYAMEGTVDEYEIVG